MLDVEFVEKIELTIALFFRDFLMCTHCVSVSELEVKVMNLTFDVMNVVDIMSFMSFVENFIFKFMNKIFSSSNNSVFTN
jgi:hypothetical protein